MRFPGFDSEWELIKLKDFANINPKSSELPSTFNYVDLESVVDGQLVKRNEISKLDAPSRAQRVLQKNDVIFQMVRPYQKNNYYFDKEGFYVASTGYAQLRTDQDSMFLYQFLHNQNFVDKVIEKCTGTSYPAINSNDLGKIKFYYPTLNEQKSIGNFLKLIDFKIVTQKKTIQVLEKLVQKFGDDILSQKIRFKSDSEEDFPNWQKMKLEDVCLKQSSNISANKIEDNFGQYPIYGATGLLKNVDFYNVDTQYIAIIKDGAGVGRLFICEEKSSVLGTLDIILPKDINLHFLYLLLSKIDFNKYTTGSTIPHIYFKDYKNENCLIPSLEEQTKIANFLNAFDKKIELETEILNKLEEQKRYFLQNLFV